MLEEKAAVVRDRGPRVTDVCGAGFTSRATEAVQPGAPG